MHKLIILIIIPLLLLVSCKNKEYRDNKSIWNDTTVCYVEKYNPDYNLDYNLKSIKNGFDSIQIRIWCDYSIFPDRQILILKNTNSKWEAELYQSTVDDNYNINKSDIRIKKLLPKNGWDNFTQNLFDKGIMYFPDESHYLKNGDCYDDGVIYTIEVALKNKYRFYEISNPNEFKEKYSEANDFIEILKLINNEFNITL